MPSWPKGPLRGSTRTSQPQQTGDTRPKYLRTASLGPRVCRVDGTTLLWTPDRPAWSNQRGPQDKKSMDHRIKKVYMRLLGAVPIGASTSGNSAAKRFLEALQAKKESRGAVPIGGTKKHQRPFFRKNVARILAEARWPFGFPRE